MQKDKIFYSFTTLDGKQCDILELRPSHIWKASLKMSQEFGIMPYLVSEILRIDGVKPSIEEIDDMYIDDYLKVGEIMSSIMEKLKI